MKRALVVLVAAVLLVAGTAPANATNDATELWHVRGVVTDATGRTLRGAHVSDGSAIAYADSSGHYDIAVSQPGRYQFYASARDAVVVLQQINVVQTETPLDFVVGYRQWATGGTSVSATTPKNIAITVYSSAPQPGGPGGPAGSSCVVVTDSRNGASSPATFNGYAPSPYSSFAKWSWELLLPAGALDGIYRLQLRVEDCATGVELSGHYPDGYPENYGGQEFEQYTVDSSAADITNVLPTDWTDPNSTITASVRQVGPSEFDKFASAVLVDGVAVPFRHQTSNGQITAPLRGLAPGQHSVEVIAVDYAGNTTRKAWTIRVDATAPGWGGQTPEGTVTDPPRVLAVRLFDAESNIDPASITMKLVGAGLPLTLAHTWDPDTGAVSHEFPLGLPDGDYRVEVEAENTVRQRVLASWSFRVATVTVSSARAATAVVR
jgi:hypothetical protein